jgi:hypothetical protein
MSAADHLSEMLALRQQGLDMYQIAAQFGVSKSRVSQLLNRPGATVTMICPECGRPRKMRRATKAPCLQCREDQRRRQNASHRPAGKTQSFQIAGRINPEVYPLLIGYKLKPIIALTFWQADRDRQGLDGATEDEQREAAEWIEHFAADILATVNITMQGMQV